jgi:arylsulfatase A-like enzyme
VRFPPKVKAGSHIRDLVICQDIAPTLIELAGGKAGAQIQGRSLAPLFAGKRKGWRKSILIEYWAEQALPWLVGMSYKAVRTDRHKLIHWVNRGSAGELDELYDLQRDPFELDNAIRSRAGAVVRERLRRELRRLVADALGV